MIKLLSAKQLKEADAFTIAHESITGIDLMERAAKGAAKILQNLCKPQNSFFVFCGPGNNGGDGFAIARLLLDQGVHPQVFLLNENKTLSSDCQINFERLKSKSVFVKEISSDSDIQSVTAFYNECSAKIDFQPVVIDALFGSGLNKSLSPLTSRLIDSLNSQHAIRIAIDLPTGLRADSFSDSTIFQAHHTITFQQPKLSFLFAENEKFVGEFHVVNIGLNEEFIHSLQCKNFLIEEIDVARLIKLRKQFDHKGTFGHAHLIAGSEEKMGAAILCAQACAKTGAGLTTVYTSTKSNTAVNIAVPEVMTNDYESLHTSSLSKKDSFAIGPGIGTSSKSKKMLLNFLSFQRSSLMVLDADALNILSSEKNKWKLIPPNSILTPHPKEFERLAVKTSNSFGRHELQKSLSEKFSMYIILKGAFTCITTPEGNTFFNPTGNSGMAKGGSGDVLTGMLAALLAQGYTSFETCLLGVYLHGLAADIVVKQTSTYSLLASDIVSGIGSAYQFLSGQVH